MTRSWADVDLGAIAANVRLLRSLAPGAELCAVVKADGYGHGAREVAAAALEAGATRLAVAQVGEGVALRQAGFDVPIWVLSEPASDEFEETATSGLEPTIYSTFGLQAAAASARATSALTVHVKVDTGMRRVGVDADDAVDLVKAIERHQHLTLGSVWTHLACADLDAEVGESARGGERVTDRQLDRYEATLECLEAEGLDVGLRHAANSAGTIGHPRSHYDVIRCGISMYGLPPSPSLIDRVPLVPALTWRTAVGFVKRVPAGEAVSYGHRQILERDSTIATFPVGYADGFSRGLWKHGGVLIGGKRRPIVGVVTMDQTIVECGDDPVSPGDEVVLVGRQGDAEIGADDLAELTGTINYEIPVTIGQRVARRYHRP